MTGKEFLEKALEMMGDVDLDEDQNVYLCLRGRAVTDSWIPADNVFLDTDGGVVVEIARNV